jgi:MinD-like ATPase involved in chromosome partitioning or flagellar assembly
MESKRGRVTTFYSYKGGTGRSMAVANVACLLSRRTDVERGVLAIDWDLEAPGLHWFFRQAGAPGGQSEANSFVQNGVIELFQYISSRMEGATQSPLVEKSVVEIVRAITLKDFVVPTTVPGVDLMVAGRFDEGYEERVNGFDWRLLFDHAPSLIRCLAEFLATKYDYVLIDSRTGLNDISGVCTTLLPDQLVLVFTPNHQSLIGGIDALTKATRYRIQSEDLRPIVIFPLPARIDVSEPELLAKWRFGDSSLQEDKEGYQHRFEALFEKVYGLPSCSLQNYFDEIQIQHVPRYSYGEEIAALHERGTRLSISRSYATLADVLAKEEPPWAMPAAAQRASELVPTADPSLAKVEAVKEYLSEDRFKLKLHDLTVREVSVVLTQTPIFGLQDPANIATFAERLRTYEAVTKDLLRIQALLGYWGEVSHRGLLGIGAKRICDQLPIQSGLTIWVYSRWYPAMLLLYSGGVAAVAAQRYENLHDLMVVPVKYPNDSAKAEPTLIRAVAQAMLELDRLDAFKGLTGFERSYTPRSNYLYTLFEPILDEVLFLGSGYEAAFDRFEVFYALEHCHRYDSGTGAHRFWGPIGRFGWKRAELGSPLDQVIAEANAEGSTWAPFQAKLFGGSLERFNEVAAGFREGVRRLNWW